MGVTPFLNPTPQKSRYRSPQKNKFGRPRGSHDKSPRKTKNDWKPYEIQILKKQFYNMSNADLAKLLNKSLISIKFKARKLNLIKPNLARVKIMLNNKGYGTIGLWNIKYGVAYIVLCTTETECIAERLSKLIRCLNNSYPDKDIGNNVLRDHWWEGSQHSDNPRECGGMNFETCYFNVGSQFSDSHLKRTHQKIYNVLENAERLYNVWGEIRLDD